jgi:hypothetical protein
MPAMLDILSPPPLLPAPLHLPPPLLRMAAMKMRMSSSR